MMMDSPIEMRPVDLWFNINTTHLVIKILSILIFPVLIVANGHLAFLAITNQIDPNTFEIVQGPFGALAILLVITTLLSRFILKLIDRNDKLRDKIEKMYKDRIDDLEKRG